MAKYHLTLKDNYDRFVSEIISRTMDKSNTISLENEASVNVDGVKIYVAAFERFAFLGNNRSSLNITFVGSNDTIHMIGTATGGSQGIFMKINTWSEEAFLDTLVSAAKEYMREHNQTAISEIYE